jgi:hypothetical protein
VADIDSPLPRSSFGSIERYVEVGGDDRVFKPGVITIEYSPEQLGWVDPESLRVFRVDVESRRWELVADSGPDGRGAVRARIEQPGVYGIVGLPEHPAVLEAVRRVCMLPDRELPSERLSPELALICLQILCAPEGDRWTGAEGPPLPPGGFDGSVCDFCTGLHHPAGGFPECQLLAPPEPPEAITEAARVYAVTANGWFGVICPYGGCKAPAWIEVFDLDPPRSTASYDIGNRWCTSLAVSSTADRLYVADVSGPEVAAYDTAGQLVRNLPLAILGGGPGVLDCALSPDDTTLYVAASYALFVIETATLTVSSVVSTNEPLGGLAVSPDGGTVAAAGAAGLHLLDTATLAHRSLAWPAAFQAWSWVWAVDVAFVDASRVLALNAASGVLLDIDLRSGGISSLSTSASAAGGPMWNNSLLYAPSSGHAYVVRPNFLGPPFSSEIITFDINGGTWSTRQFQGYLTIPALTPSGQVLVVHLPGGAYVSESLAMYDPASQQLSPNLCGAPFFNISDMKAVAS